MKVQSITPPAAIAAYISEIIVMENEHTFHEAVLPLIPRGFPSIAFQLTDPGMIIGGPRKVDNLVLYGQNLEPIQLHTARHLTVIAFFVYPHMLYALFGIHAKELTDQCIDIDLLPAARDLRLRERLLNAGSQQQRLELLGNYVARLAGRQRLITNETVIYATRLILQHKGQLSMMQVQQELCITERTLQRQFEQHVGISPKTFGRICQFQAALQMLNQQGFSDMPGIAYENGYADQSHLIRAFKTFTHHTPGEYLRLAQGFPG
ncbi:AraC family transcriptional regulator [Chitinophaga vietnamensis]|uniref:AraC family transcriptional regulator n=1 Tax=Chitinophaga vietnamensis TaxID=2593957 RepID=UPI0011784F5A|nr:helix-turn-helix domain-containing protein [Chitinophaga vietnamensis]